MPKSLRNNFSSDPANIPQQLEKKLFPKLFAKNKPFAKQKQKVEEVPKG